MTMTLTDILLYFVQCYELFVNIENFNCEHCHYYCSFYLFLIKMVLGNIYTRSKEAFGEISREKIFEPHYTS